MMPGMIGTSIPARARGPRKSKYTALSKNSCVIRKSTPARTFSARCAGRPRDSQHGCVSPGSTPRRPQTGSRPAISSTSSRRVLEAAIGLLPNLLPGRRVARAAPARCRCPPRASPRASRAASGTVAPTHVKCAIASRPYSSRMRLTISIVFSLVDPPAPYVTDTNDGSSVFSSASAPYRLCSPAGVFGGKNSNENTGRRWSARI